MGHDITAHLGDADPIDPPYEYLEGWSELPDLAYLRRGASNPLRHTLYEVLDAQEYDGDVSGVWAARWFSREQLRVALRRLWLRRHAGESVKPEIRFVQACLDGLPADRSWVYVAFG